MASPAASTTQSAPWQLIAVAKGIDPNGDEDSRKRVLNAWHSELQKGRKVFFEGPPTNTHAEQLEVAAHEFGHMHVTEAEHAQNKGGWTDHEASNDAPGNDDF